MHSSEYHQLVKGNIECALLISRGKKASTLYSSPGGKTKALALQTAALWDFAGVVSLPYGEKTLFVAMQVTVKETPFL